MHPVFRLLHPYMYWKFAVALNCSTEFVTVPFLPQLPDFRRELSQQDPKVGSCQERVVEPAKTFRVKKHPQQGTVRSPVWLVDSAILRAPVPDKPLHTTSALHFGDVRQTQRSLKGIVKH